MIDRVWTDWGHVPDDAAPLVVFELASTIARRLKEDVELNASALERARVRFEEMQEKHRKKIGELAKWAGLAEDAGRVALRFAERRGCERRRREHKRDERSRLDEGRAAQGG